MSNYPVENNEQKLRKIALSEIEAEECFNRGLVSRDFYTVYRGSWVEKAASGLVYNYPEIPQRAKEAGAKFVIDLGSLSPCLFFTENFVVAVIKPYESFQTKGTGTTKRGYDGDAKAVYLIPISKIKSIRFDSKEFSGSHAPITKTVQGDAVKGAVVGGILGGTAGAVIGAAVASKPKTKTTFYGGSYDIINLYADIEFDRVVFSGIEMFSGDRKRNRPDDKNKWTMIMNGVICGITHNTDAICSGEIIETYENVVQRLLDGAVDFDERLLITKKLEDVLGVNLGLSKYCSKNEFVNSIVEKGDIQKLPKNIFEELNTYKKIQDKRDALKQAIESKREELGNLGLFKASEKKSLTSEIQSLESEIESLEYKTDVYALIRNEYLSTIQDEMRNAREREDAKLIETIKESINRFPQGEGHLPLLSANKLYSASPALQEYTIPDIERGLTMLLKQGYVVRKGSSYLLNVRNL